MINYPARLTPAILNNPDAAIAWALEAEHGPGEMIRGTRISKGGASEEDVFAEVARVAGWSKGDAYEMVPEGCPYALIGAINAPPEDEIDWD